MTKKDYKSYNVLGEELELEINEREINHQITKDKENQITEENIQVVEEVAKEVSPYRSVLQDKAEDKAEKDKVQGNQVRDTSFTTYVDQSQKRERGFVEKWVVRLIKLALFIMLLPIIGIVGIGTLTTAGVVIGGIVACIGSGMVILLGTVFVASQLSSSLIALGIAASISAISLGLIVALLCGALVKGIIRLITSRRTVNRRQKQEKEER